MKLRRLQAGDLGHRSHEIRLEFALVSRFYGSRRAQPETPAKHFITFTGLLLSTKDISRPRDYQ